ncbi:MAG: GNAT family N-acetyltransferase [Acidimicrobiia bacterium]
MPTPTSLDLLRALVDPLRLAVAGNAVGGPVSIEVVADLTGAEKRDVAGAVGDLRALGLLDDDGMLQVDVLRVVARELPRDKRPEGVPVEGPWTPREAETLGNFFDGDRLVKMPSSASKRRLVVEKFAQEFEPGRRYPERDVNFKIQLMYHDYAAVRRYMVEEGFMDRADGAYWRTGGRYETPEIGEVQPDDRDLTLATAIDGVELRPYGWEMVEDLMAAASDDRIPRFMGDQFASPYTRDDAESWIEVATKNDPPTQYAIFVDGALSGGIGGFPASGENTGDVEIGWWLHPDHWGRGITSACARVLVNEFLGNRGYMRLWAPVMHVNIASARVAESAGLTFEGSFPSAYLKGGVRYDQHNYGITRAQWVADRNKAGV